MALCTPLIAAGGLADLGMQEEVCAGQFPQVPAMRTVRRRSTTLGLTKDSYNSEETRSDRMVADSRHGIRRVGGDIVVELSPGSHADAWEAELGGIWQSPAATPMGTYNVVLSVHPDYPNDPLTARMTISGTTFVARAIRSGDTVAFVGNGDVNLDGTRVSIAAITAGNQATVRLEPGAVPVLPKTVNSGTMEFMGARVEMGSILRSFIFERAFTDIGSFITYRGCRFNTAAVDLPSTGIATATFAVLGQTADDITGGSFDGDSQIVLTQADLTALTFNAAAGTITAAAGNFDALEPGQKVIFDGAGFDAMPQNRNPRTIIAVNGAVITVAEAIQSGTTAGSFTVTRVGLPDYASAPTNPVLVAVNGLLLVNDEPAATVTAANFTVDNQMAGSEVVGSNVIPAMLFGNNCTVQGSLTVLFDRGGIGATIYNAFDHEEDITLLLRMDDNEGGFLSFFFPRVKVNTGSIGDAAAEGLPVQVDFSAVKPYLSSGHRSQIIVQDSTVAGVPPIDTTPSDVVTGKGLTFTINGVGSPAPTITLSGGPATTGGTITVTVKVNGQTAEVDDYSFASADTTTDVAADLAATIDALVRATATVDSGNTSRVNVGISAGAYVEALTIVIT